MFPFALLAAPGPNCCWPSATTGPDAARSDVKAAGFPREKWLGDFDFYANPKHQPATISPLATGVWVQAGHPLCLIGEPGTGKSHLLIGLGTADAEAGYRVKYSLATNSSTSSSDDPQRPAIHDDTFFTWRVQVSPSKAQSHLEHLEARRTIICPGHKGSRPKPT